MPSHRGGWRVAIVVRPLDRALDLLRLVLIPLVLVGVSLPMLRAVGGTFEGSSKGWLFALTGVAVALAYVLLLHTDAVGSRVDLALARVRRRVTLACQQDLGGANRDARIACWLTPEVLRAPLFRYDQQNRAVLALTEACRAEQGQYWFLEGRSGSGKTRTALLLVQALVRDLSLLQFGNRSYLYDFGDDESVQDTLLRRLGTSRHDEAVVLVDNFHLVRPDVLHVLTTRLVDRRTRSPERIIIFLARPLDAWNLSPDAEVRLVSEARAESHHLELGGPTAESVARSLTEFDPVGSDRVWELTGAPVASAPQLRLAQVIARHRSMPPEVAAVLGLLEGDAMDPTALELAPVLAAVTALSMHRGAFTRRDFRRAVRATTAESSPWASGVQGLKMWTSLRRLRRVELVSRSHRGAPRYEFHETMAKLCIDRLATLPAFQIPFTAVGRTRLDELLSRREPLTAWLAAVEIGAQDVAAATFDAAMASGPYTRMLRCLRRARKRYPLSAPLGLQHAILLDRTGDFAASRAEFSNDLMAQLDPTSELSIIFAATRLEASHDPAAVAAGLEFLTSNPNRLIEIVGEYWKLHIAAHRGRFASRELLGLATEALGLIRSNDSHWLNYSLGRMHFDSLRHHYLEGGTPVEAVVAPQRRALVGFLRPRLASYDAFEVLYTKAHLVGHVLLPQRAVYLEPVSPEQAALAGLAPADVATVGALVASMGRLYRQARDQFAQYGDREATYLQVDVLNADMVEAGRDLDEYLVGLSEYERFIAGTGFDDIASYPHLYYLRWHMLKYYATARDARAVDAGAIDKHLDAAWRHLRRIVELDSAVRNEYGLMRAKLLDLLLRWVRDPPRPDELTALSVQMAERGYGREQRLLDHLTSGGLLGIFELERIFRFYPFVGQ